MSSYTFKMVDLSDSVIDKVEITCETLEGLSFHVTELRNIQNRNRMVLSFTKSRSDFSSGGAKPYKQKGTGNARLGTSRSPLKVGGSVIFGPKPRVVTRKINRKLVLNIMKNLLCSKSGSSKILSHTNSVESLKDTKNIFDASKKYLLMIDSTDASDIDYFTVIKNLRNVTVVNIASLRIDDILSVNELVYTRAAFANFQEKGGF